MAQKIFRTGNSLAITIPSAFASTVGIHAGASVKVAEDRERARLILQFSGHRQLPLDTAFFKNKKRKPQT